MRRKRSGMPRMLGSESYTVLRQGTISRNPFKRDKCPPEMTDELTDSSSPEGMASDDELLFAQRWAEHHGQLHDLDQNHGEWIATRSEPIDLERAKDGTIKFVKTAYAREEYL